MWIQPEALILESGIPRERMLPNLVGRCYWEGGDRQTCHSMGGQETKSFNDLYVHDRRGPPRRLRRLEAEEVWQLQGRSQHEFRAWAEEIGEKRAADEGSRATGAQTAANLMAGAGALIGKTIEAEACRVGTSPDQTGAEAMAQILLWLRRWKRGEFGSPSNCRKAGGEDGGHPGL